MKKLIVYFSFAAISHTMAADLPAGHTPLDHAAATNAATHGEDSGALTEQGSVASFIDVKGYTYIEVSRNAKSEWLAVPTTTVKVGDTIRFGDGPVMLNYRSKSLNRTFSSVTFVSRVVVSNPK